jgi:predicted MFS family arabinose efflux permease
MALLALGPATALGWARFSYALLLPAMQNTLGWSYAQAGALNTANALGYLLGALLAAALARRFGLRRTFRWSFAGVVVALFGCALTAWLPALLTLRVLAGIGGAAVVVTGAVLAAAGAKTPRRVSLYLALYFAAVGLGIALSAVTIPPLLARLGPGAWPWGWAVLGGLSLMSLGLVQLALGYFDDIPQGSGERLRLTGLVRLTPIAISYGMFGMGYIGYMTFIVAFLHAQGIANTEVPIVWAALGVAAIVASFVWGSVFHRLYGARGMAVVLAVVMIGVLFPLLGTGIAMAVGSALLFGGSMLAAPSAVTYFVHQAIQPRRWTGVFAALTVCFGIGQTIGPILFGAIADSRAGMSAGFVVSAAILLVGIAAALFQRERIDRS